MIKFNKALLVSAVAILGVSATLVPAISTVEADSTDSVSATLAATPNTTSPLSNAGVHVLSATAPLYDAAGNKTSRSVAGGSDWVTDQVTGNGTESYYRVSTNEFVSGNDVNLYSITNNNIKITTAGPATLYSSTGIELGTRALATGTVWFSDRVITVDHVAYARVSTNEWVSADEYNIVD